MSSIPCWALPNGLCIPCFGTILGLNYTDLITKLVELGKKFSKNTKHICCMKEATVWWLFCGPRIWYNEKNLIGASKSLRDVTEN